MTHHEITVNEGITLADSTSGVEAPERMIYRVLVELFKNGRLYQPGTTIVLDPVTAARFIDLAEIQEIP